MRTGPANLVTDVPGLLVGNAQDRAGRTGVTVVLPERPAVASVAVLGGAPGTRETDLLAPEQTVETVDAIVLSGGSAFGLDAAGGVMQALAAAGRGFAVGPVRVPIVPAAILFDLLSGGEKPWLDGLSEPPYRALGLAATAAAARIFAIGSEGAGTGATTAGLKGGLGSASAVLSDGTTVGALVAVNALGSTTFADGPHFRAAPHEIGAEFGGLGLPPPGTPGLGAIRTKLDAAARGATTIAVVATDRALTKPAARRLALAAHDGLARAIHPVHTPLDGDLVFALSTGLRPAADDLADRLELSAVAADTLARAVARGVHAATAEPGDPLPTWSLRHGRR